MSTQSTPIPLTATNPLQTPPLAQPTDTLKFFLANVGFTQTASDIKSYIEQYFGSVNFVKLIPYRDPNVAVGGDVGGAGGSGQKHKGYGFLYMLTEEGATALENYVNAFPGNKIRLIDREGVYVAKHDERRANQGSAIHAGSLSATNGYHTQVDANGYSVQPSQTQYAAPVGEAVSQQAVNYSQPQPQGAYPNTSQQPVHQYAYQGNSQYAAPGVDNQYASVPPVQNYSQQHGYVPAPQQQQGSYVQHPQQISQPAYRAQPLQYNSQPIQQAPPPQQSQYPQPPQQGAPPQQIYSQQHPQYNQQQGPPPQQITYSQQPGPSQVQSSGPPMQNTGPLQMQQPHQLQGFVNPSPQNTPSSHYGSRGGRHQGGSKYPRGGGRGRGGNTIRGGGRGRAPPPPPLSRPNMQSSMGPSMMSGPIMGNNMGPGRGMPPPPPPRGGRGRGGRDGTSFRGGRGGGRNNRDMRRDRPY